MGVSAIKEIANKSALTFGVKNMENSGTTPYSEQWKGMPVRPGETWPCDIWVPWADDEAAFQAGKYIYFYVTGSGIFLSVFQSKGFIWCSKGVGTPSYEGGGKQLNTEGGDRRLELHGDQADTVYILI